MDPQERTLGRRALQFFGLRDEELTIERQRRRARFLGGLLIAVGVFMACLALLVTHSTLGGVYGIALLIVGCANLVHASRLEDPRSDPPRAIGSDVS